MDVFEGTAFACCVDGSWYDLSTGVARCECALPGSPPSCGYAPAPGTGGTAAPPSVTGGAPAPPPPNADDAGQDDAGQDDAG